MIEISLTVFLVLLSIFFFGLVVYWIRDIHKDVQWYKDQYSLDDKCNHEWERNILTYQRHYHIGKRSKVVKMCIKCGGIK